MVTSFDGGKNFPQNVSRIVHKGWPGLQKKFVYEHLALLDKPGFVNFWQSEREGGKIVPGEKIRTSTTGEISADRVNGTTVDLYAEQKGIKALDVLKVDAEGYDDSVLHGANRSLASTLLFVYFEASPLRNEPIDCLVHAYTLVCAHACAHIYERAGRRRSTTWTLLASRAIWVVAGQDSSS